MPSLEKLIEKFALFPFNAFDLLANACAAQQLGDDLIMRGHA
jgi:hypothetical protein